MRIIVLLFLLAAASDTDAQTTLYRCTGAGGSVTIQDKPCSAAQRTSKIMQDDIRDDPRATLRLQEIEREMSRRNTRSEISSSHAYQRVSSSPSKASQCDAAKSRRDATLKQVGLRRNFDLLRQLDEHVYQACK